MIEFYVWSDNHSSKKIAILKYMFSCVFYIYNSVKQLTTCCNQKIDNKRNTCESVYIMAKVFIGVTMT